MCSGDWSSVFTVIDVELVLTVFCSVCVCLFVCLFVWLSVCLYDCLFVWLFVCLSDCLFVCMSVCFYACLCPIQAWFWTRYLRTTGQTEARHFLSFHKRIFCVHKIHWDHRLWGIRLQVIPHSYCHSNSIPQDWLGGIEMMRSAMTIVIIGTSIWMNKWMKWMNKWMKWMSEWVSEWMSEWMNEWIN